MGGVACPIVASSYGHNSLQCVLPPGLLTRDVPWSSNLAGTGSNLPVVVTSNGQDSVGGATFSCKSLVPTSFLLILHSDNLPSIATVTPTTGPTSGGTVVVLTGTNFGATGQFAPVSTAAR